MHLSGTIYNTVIYKERTLHEIQLGRRCLWRKLYVYFEVIVRGESRKEYLWRRPYYAAIQNHAFPTMLGKDDSKIFYSFITRTFAFFHVHSRALLTKSTFLFILMSTRGRSSFEWST